MGTKRFSSHLKQQTRQNQKTSTQHDHRNSHREGSPHRGRGLVKAIELFRLGRVFHTKGKPDHHALKDLTLDVTAGEVHALLGPNGAGKTTLCRILSTTLIPTSGTARVFGRDVVGDAASVKRSVGVVFGGDKGLYPRLTARQNLMFWGAIYGVPRRERTPRIDTLLDRVGLTDRSDEPVHVFSRGMKQRLHLARGMVANPGVLILDEPTAGMDPVAAHDFRAMIRKLRRDGTSVLMTTHDMAEAAALSDRVSFIDAGEIKLTATPNEVGNVVSARERIDAHDVTPRLLQHLQDTPGVASVTVNADNGLVRIETENPQTTRTVLLSLVEAGVTDVARSNPTLEEVYLHLIGRRGMGVRQ